MGDRQRVPGARMIRRREKLVRACRGSDPEVYSVCASPSAGAAKSWHAVSRLFGFAFDQL